MLLIIIAALLSSNFHQIVNGHVQQVPCFFIFGDSLVDSGNNNNLETLAKVNYPPYGIDFPGGIATGRFTNGKTAVDFLGEFLGFNSFIPSYPSSETSEILQGVNYASASAGILDDTGKNLGTCVSMNGQLANHQNIIKRMTATKFGNDSAAASEHLRKCLYYVGLGSNDFLNNYFLPHKPSQQTSEQYAELLVNQYSKQLKKLYDMGARKIAIFGVGMIGCTPHAIATHAHGILCAQDMNHAASQFSDKLKPLVTELNNNLTDAQFIYINAGGGKLDPSMLGFRVFNKGCCEVNEVGQCIPNKTPCRNRDQYVFWDSFHPTEPVHRMSALNAYNSTDPSAAYPFNIHHLVTLSPTASA